MTKEQIELLRMTKGISFRRTRRVVQKISERVRVWVRDVKVLLGLIDHISRKEYSNTDTECVTKNAGHMRIENGSVAFNIQVNKWYSRFDFIDKYVNSKTGVILEDNSYTTKTVMYTAFPINVCLVINGEYCPCDRPDSKLVIKTPWITRPHGTGKEYVRYADYVFDLQKFKGLRVDRTCDDIEFSSRKEAIDYENEIIIDMVHKFKKYLEEDFKLTDYFKAKEIKE